MPADIEHESVRERQPCNPKSTIWRYVDFPKLIDILHTQELHFTRIDTLSDPFEGHVPSLNHLRSIARKEHHIEKWATQLRRTFGYVNCWSGLETESVAMWALYGSSVGGFAIQSTYDKLVSVLSSDVYVGQVEYMRYNTQEEMISPYNVLNPLIRKRVEYKHEEEIRGFIFDTRSLETEQQEPPSHIRIGIEIEKLIDSIYIQSTAPEWILGLVRRLLKEYGFSFPVRRSVINLEPLWWG